MSVVWSWCFITLSIFYKVNSKQTSGVLISFAHLMTKLGMMCAYTRSNLQKAFSLKYAVLQAAAHFQQNKKYSRVCITTLGVAQAHHRFGWQIFETLMQKFQKSLKTFAKQNAKCWLTSTNTVVKLLFADNLEACNPRLCFKKCFILNNSGFASGF